MSVIWIDPWQSQSMHLYAHPLSNWRLVWFASTLICPTEYSEQEPLANLSDPGQSRTERTILQNCSGKSVVQHNASATSESITFPESRPEHICIKSWVVRVGGKLHSSISSIDRVPSYCSQSASVRPPPGTFVSSTPYCYLMHCS